MIIGILGEKNAGKSTLGKMLNGLIQGHSDSDIINSILTGTSLKPLKPEQLFETKKFADILKDMLCIFLGCTRDNLEDQKFKNTWIGYSVYKIKLNYTDKKGKDQEVFFNQIFNSQTEVDKEIKRHKTMKYNYVLSNSIPIYKSIEINVTPRYLMETLGTDWGRKMINPRIWVNKLFDKYVDDYRPTLFKNEIYEVNDELDSEIKYIIPSDSTSSGEVVSTPYSVRNKYRKPLWIIDDVRMPEEISRINDQRHSFIIYIEKEDSEKELNNKLADSEKAEQYKNYANYDVKNNGTLNELLYNAKAIIRKISGFSYYNIDISHLYTRQERIDRGLEVEPLEEEIPVENSTNFPIIESTEDRSDTFINSLY